MTLSEIQIAFSRFLRGKADFPLDEIAPAGTLTPAASAEVYRTAYTSRLTEALGETFEAVWRVLGDENFFDVCRKYIAGHDSSSPNLSDYGSSFPSFTSESFPDFPFLSDLAHFEWEWKDAFHAPECAFRASDLETDDPGSLILEFVPSFRIFSSPYAILTLWEHREDEAEDGSGIDWAGPEYFYVVRHRFTMMSHRLTAEEFGLVSALCSGTALGPAVEEASMSELEVGTLFRHLVESGAVAGGR